MFDKLSQPAPDKIIQLMGLFKADPRANKVDLGVGVYKNAEGLTPIMSAVKAAEQKLWHAEDTKTYTALAGDAGYHDAMIALILAGVAERERVAAAATPGGTGAVRNAIELVKMATPDATVWISDPTWPNHPAIINYVGLSQATYHYIDPATRTVNFSAMMEDLNTAKPGDIVLLHGCCHNPTGANLSPSQWQELADLLRARKLIPFVDIAYQGFGDGLDADAFGVRHLAKTQDMVLIAASCSKNFGIYRERAGILIAVSADATQSATVQANLAAINRLNYSFPPDHGARLVTMILTDPELRSDWEAELEDVRTGMLSLRQKLSDALRQRTNSERFDFLAEHRGMFSRLGATPEQVAQMRDEHAVYMIGDSRMNIAGLNDRNIDILADAIAAVGV